MKVEQLVVGQLKTNCYLVWDEDSSEGIIIDPGDDADYIIRKISDYKIIPKLIIATHGHFDHILGILELKLAFSIPFWVNRLDLFLLKRSSQTAQYFLGVSVDLPAIPDNFLKEGDIIRFGKEKLVVWETSGHTPGSICLLGKGVIFSGDTVFAEGFGRTDFSYSSKRNLEKSLQRILQLPMDTVVYPGHGETTTVGEIRK